jgi:hypothetical protein
MRGLSPRRARVWNTRRRLPRYCKLSIRRPAQRHGYPAPHAAGIHKCSKAREGAVSFLARSIWSPPSSSARAPRSSRDTGHFQYLLAPRPCCTWPAVFSRTDTAPLRVSGNVKPASRSTHLTITVRSSVVVPGNIACLNTSRASPRGTTSAYRDPRLFSACGRKIDLPSVPLQPVPELSRGPALYRCTGTG